MFDITFLIPDDYEMPPWRVAPECPEDEMTDAECERLDMEMYRRIDNGALNIDNELPF